jgi:uncharacterized protein (DUF885 family)
MRWLGILLLSFGIGSAQVATAQDSASSLALLAQEYWEAELRADPVRATLLGDRRYDALLDDITPAGIASRRASLERFLQRARAIEPDRLSPADRLTRQVLVTEIEGQLAQLACDLESWVVDPLDGPHVDLLNIEAVQPVRTPAEGRAMVERWRAMGPYLDAHIANLRRGLGEGKVAVRTQVERTIAGLQETIDQKDEDLPLLTPLRTPHPEWSDAERREFETGLRSAVRDVARPAYKRYRSFLEKEILPKARSNDEPGIARVPGGLECYRRLIRVHTSLDLSPDEIHATGLREVERIDRETEALGAKLFGLHDRAKVVEKLRTDPALHFSSGDEVQKKAESALARAQAAIPKWFGILPRAGCVVTPMLAHEEKNSTVAYYRQPATDGSRPGRYYINRSAPETRPRYEAEALAWHEAIPGHHLQIAIAQELTGIPEFRKHAGVTAFVEGWALYTERLADEMGLYSSDIDRMGMLSYDSWRACRLVVDTGMHALGWTRKQAIDFMLAHSALAENNIVNEVDRYISWPAQALAYKTGQLEILRLRAEAERELGAAFDIRAFHDAVLQNGAIALVPLREAVHEHIRTRRAPGRP